MSFDPNNPAGSGMVLTFDDEFNSLSASSNGPANGTTWTQINGNPNLSAHDGVLDITSVQNGNGWTGGELLSTNQQGQGFAQKFGYFEARIECSVAGGSFVMFSQAHAQNGAAPATELDVLESDPGGHPTDVLDTLHLNSNGVPGADQTNLATGGNPFVDVGIPLAQGFHTYGALWDPNSPDITWYFDGRAVAEQPKFSDTDSAPMLLDIQAGIGLQQGAPQAAGENIPAVNHTYVDYVHAWQFSNQNPTPVADPAPAPSGIINPAPPAPNASIDPAGHDASHSGPFSPLVLPPGLGDLAGHGPLTLDHVLPPSLIAAFH